MLMVQLSKITLFSLLASYNRHLCNVLSRIGLAPWVFVVSRAVLLHPVRMHIGCLALAVASTDHFILNGAVVDLPTDAHFGWAQDGWIGRRMGWHLCDYAVGINKYDPKIERFFLGNFNQSCLDSCFIFYDLATAPNLLETLLVRRKRALTHEREPTRGRSANPQ